MKNIQVIDDAKNCSFSIYEVADEDFSLIFPATGQDVEFVEDIIKRLGNHRTGELVQRTTSKRVEKPYLNGLHGTLFFGMLERKKWYPNKREDDFDRPYSSDTV